METSIVSLFDQLGLLPPVILPAIRQGEPSGATRYDRFIGLSPTIEWSAYYMS